MRLALAVCLLIVLSGCVATARDAPMDPTDEGSQAQDLDDQVASAESDGTAASYETSWHIPAKGNASLVARWSFEGGFHCRMWSNTTVSFVPGAVHIHRLEAHEKVSGEAFLVADLLIPAGRSIDAQAGGISTGPAYDAAVAVVLAATGYDSNTSYADVTLDITFMNRDWDVVYTVGGSHLLEDPGMPLEMDCGAPPTLEVARDHEVWVSGQSGSLAGGHLGLNVLGATLEADLAFEASDSGRLAATQHEGLGAYRATSPQGHLDWKLGTVADATPFQVVEAGAGDYALSGSGAGTELLVLFQDLRPAASPLDMV